MRIDRIMFAVAFLQILAAVCAQAGETVAPKPQEQHPGVSPTSVSQVEKALQTSVYPALEDVDINTAILFLKTSANLPVVLDAYTAPVIKDVRVTVTLPAWDPNAVESREMTAGEVLALTAKSGGLKSRIEGDAVFVATAERMEEIDRMEKPINLSDLPKSFSAPKSCEVDGQPLPDVLAVMAEVAGVNVVMSGQDQFELRDAPVTLHVTDVPVAGILRFLIRQHKLDMQIVGEALFVARPETLRNAGRLPAIDDQSFKERLGKRISYRCIDRRLPSVVNDLAELAGLPIEYDAPTDYRPPLCSFTFADLPASTALDLLIRSCRLSGKIEGDRITLSPTGS